MRNVVLTPAFAVFAAAASARAQAPDADGGAASWNARDEVRIYHTENRSPTGNTGLTSLVPQREWIRSAGSGKWQHETELIAGGQIRVGHTANAPTSAAVVLNGFGGQREEYHVSKSTHVYGHLEVGGRGGL